MIVFPKLLCYSTIIEVVKLKKNKNELVKKGNSTLKEFKQFISKGNVIDLAVGVIIGSAFGNRDHTTVMNACLKIEKLYTENENYKLAINKIKKLLTTK